MTKDAKIAITGATGFLGGYLVAQLLKSGFYDITLLVRNRKRICLLQERLNKEGVDFKVEDLKTIEVELNNPRELALALQGIDTVFHTAAVVSFSDDNPSQLIETNVEMTSHLVNAALESGVRRLVHTSSIAALGGMKQGKMYIDETTLLEDMSTTSPYGQSKFLAENQVWRGSELGLEVVVVNPGVILGVGDFSSGGSMLVVPFLLKGLPFYTQGVTGYVDVRDVARAEVMLAQNSKATGQSFVLVGENLSFKTIITLGAEVSGKRKPWFNATEWITEFVWRAEAVICKLFARKPLFTSSAARSAQQKSYYNGEKIKQYIDFKYTPIKNTITELVSAYKTKQ